MLKLRFLILILFISSECMSQINIWENTDCDEYVTLTPYLSPGTNNPAIIILPGGSYFWHAKKTEGKEVALWLQKNGISAFVLNYRTAKVPAFIFRYRYFFRGNRYPDPQNDLRQALKLIRKNAEQYGIDVNHYGMVLCPFHNDRHPSLYVSDDHYHCFACGEHGDVIDLTAKLFDLRLYDAARKLASDFHLALDKPLPEAIRR